MQIYFQVWLIDKYDNDISDNTQPTVEWSINSLQFLNPFRIFVVWLFSCGYSIIFLFMSLFIFILTLFIPLSLTGHVSKYIKTYNDGCKFMFANIVRNSGKEMIEPIKNPPTPSCKNIQSYKPITFQLQNTANYFWFLRNFLYRNKNYILYISIIYTIIDITFSYNDSAHLISFLICILIIWLLGMFGYSVDNKYSIEIYKKFLPQK